MRGDERLECRLRKGKLLAIIVLLPFPAAAASLLLGWWWFGSVVGARAGLWASGAIGVLIAAFWLRLIYEFIVHDVVVIIDEAGIEDRRNGLGVLQWEDIEHVGVERDREGVAFRIRLRDEAAYLRRLPAWRQICVKARRAWMLERGIKLECWTIKPGEDALGEWLTALLDEEQRGWEVMEE